MSLPAHTYNSRFQVHEYRSGHVLSASGLVEECVEGIVCVGLGFGHFAIRLDTVLQTVQLPAGIAHLDTSLADMDGDTLTLEKKR